MTQHLASPVSLTAVDAPDQPTPTPALEELYRGFEGSQIGSPTARVDLRSSDLAPRFDAMLRVCTWRA